MTESTTELNLGGNLRMTLVHDVKAARYTAGVYRRLRGTAPIAGVAIAAADHAQIIAHPRDAAASLWIGATKFSVPPALVGRIEEFFGIRAVRGKEKA